MKKMQIQRSNFNCTDIERYGTGAGIIPLAIGPDGEYHMLLGRERFLPQWKGSCRWSGFEGSRKTHESLQDAAIREFMEESLGVVISKTCEVTEIIDRRDYWLRIVLRISNEKRSERYHSTYVIQVHYDASIAERFANQRTEIERLERLSKEMQRLFPTFALVSGKVVEIGSVEILEHGGIRLQRFVYQEEDSESPGTREAFFMRCQDAYEDASDDDDDDENVRWIDDEPIDLGKMQHIILPAEHPFVARVCAWDAIRLRLETDLSDHSSVDARMGVQLKRLQELHIYTDHLEKDQIRWWSVSDLRRVLDLRGFIGNDCFRPYFLPILQTALHELSHAPPGTLVSTLGNAIERVVEEAAEAAEAEEAEEAEEKTTIGLERA